MKRERGDTDRTPNEYRGKNTRSKGKPAKLTLSAKAHHERSLSVEKTPGPGGKLLTSKTVETARVGREEEATLSIELPGGQQLLTFRIACPS